VNKLVKRSRQGAIGLPLPPSLRLPAGSSARRKPTLTSAARRLVSLEDGTGVLHAAPRYGEADLAMGQSHDLPLIESVEAAALIYAQRGARQIL